LGRSRGGFSTKIHAIVDTEGRPLHIELTGGQRHEMTKADDLLLHATGEACLGDGGYDTDWFRDLIAFLGMRAVIPSASTRKKKRRPPKTLYRMRYLVEYFFHGLKRFRRIATRFEKTARNFLAIIHLACVRIWLN
jgi:transposase